MIYELWLANLYQGSLFFFLHTYSKVRNKKKTYWWWGGDPLLRLIN